VRSGRAGHSWRHVGEIGTMKSNKKMKKKTKAKDDSAVEIIEVGLRDGLQNEKTTLSIADRHELAQRLALAGTRELELGAFVSAQWVPQMAGSTELIKAVIQERRDKGSAFKRVRLSALVPNRRGLEAAIESGVERIAIFASASETFSKKNINCSIKESFIRYRDVIEEARLRGLTVRGYLSMCFGCPFEGKVSESKVVKYASMLVDIGCDEVSIGDTIGIADPKQVARIGKALISELGKKDLAMHFHDTRGTALANILASLEIGLRSFDSSIGGLGGCPYAPAATGNVATEDVVYMLHRMGMKTGLDLAELVETARWLQPKIGHELPSKVSRAGLPIS
jgi:hydroxymethylglutaryl-CoA lyase